MRLLITILLAIASLLADNRSRPPRSQSDRSRPAITERESAPGVLRYDRPRA